jgi:Na+-driven multidrug efflux pump
MPSRPPPSTRLLHPAFNPPPPSGHLLVALFCSDAAVVGRCLDALPFLAALVGLDGLNSTCSGVLRGSGRQKLGAAINIIGYVGG